MRTRVRVPRRVPIEAKRSASAPWNSRVMSDVASAIDLEGGTGDHFGIRRGQEYGRPGEIFRAVQTTPRNRADETLPPFGFISAYECREHRRVCGDRTDRHDSNAMRCDLQRERLGQR